MDFAGKNHKVREMKKMEYLAYILFGYFSGSVMYAYLIPKCLCGVDVRKISDDGNPGAANVFKYVGIWQGILVILLEIAKGFVPVFLAGRHLSMRSLLFSLVLAAPVYGHAFPFWNRRGGGKSIAVSFGSLLGLYPLCMPVLALAGLYILFSVILVITPHLFRSVITYGLFCGYSLFFVDNRCVMAGCLLISLLVIWKHLKKYQGERLKIRLGRREIYLSA